MGRPAGLPTEAVARELAGLALDTSGRLTKLALFLQYLFNHSENGCQSFEDLFVVANMLMRCQDMKKYHRHWLPLPSRKHPKLLGSTTPKPLTGHGNVGHRGWLAWLALFESALFYDLSTWGWVKTLHPGEHHNSW